MIRKNVRSPDPAGGRVGEATLETRVDVLGMPSVPHAAVTMQQDIMLTDFGAVTILVQSQNQNVTHPQTYICMAKRSDFMPQCVNQNGLREQKPKWRFGILRET